MKAKSKVDFNKISVHAGPEHSPGLLLWQVSTSWRASLEKVLKAFDLTHPQFVVLSATAWLTQNGERVTQIAVGKMAGLDPNTCSQIMRGLESKKMIAREKTADARAKSPVLTPVGAEVLKKALPAVETEDQAFFRALDAKDISSMINVFRKLV